jgi:hypothetical protein
MFKGTVQRYFNSVFFTYMDKPRPENEPLLTIKSFRNSENFLIRNGSYSGLAYPYTGTGMSKNGTKFSLDCPFKVKRFFEKQRNV